MSSTTYRIVQRADSTYAVEIARVGSLPQMAAGFATEAAAKGWIAQDERFHASADPFHTPSGRKRHGF